MKLRRRRAADPSDVARLGKLLLMGRNAALRARAADTLAELGLVCAWAYLRHALWDPEEVVRASAIDAIGDLAVVQSAGELAAVYAWSDSRLRRAIVRAVMRIGTGSAFDGILSLASIDPDRRVRALAARAVRPEPFRRGRS
jgi:hypothetical protein